MKTFSICSVLLMLLTAWVGAASHICETEVPAFDPANPKAQIGTFAPNTQLEINGDANSEGMVPVTFTNPKGEVIHALCKKEAVYKTASTAPVSAEKSPETKTPAKTDTSKWITDYQKALEIAKTENKHVLLDFTGSDWCGWCMKLDKEVFSKQEFKDYAKENLVLVTLDFPEEKSISFNVKTQNKKLAKEFNIKGYPTIILLNADGKKVAETGYLDGGPKKYVEHLKQLIKRG